eukprot:GGOE01007656.1.p1 GENE.GGOE01007656.1~~GGOE01007656.1.p1  ORF type:complete len:251 (-),score=38.80 GGOE01007656.1:1327-1983(-)
MRHMEATRKGLPAQRSIRRSATEQNQQLLKDDIGTKHSHKRGGDTHNSQSQPLPPDVFELLLSFLMTDVVCGLSCVCRAWEEGTRVRRGCWLVAPGKIAFVTCTSGGLVSGRIMCVALQILRMPELSCTDLCLQDECGRVVIVLQINATYGVCYDPDKQIGIGDIAMIMTKLPEDALATPPPTPATKCLSTWRSTRGAHRFGNFCRNAPTCTTERVLW